MSYIVGRIENGDLVQDWTSAAFEARRDAVKEAVEARSIGREIDHPLQDTHVYDLVECEFVDERPRESGELIMGKMTEAQREALAALCERYDVEFDPDAFGPGFGLPSGYVAGQVGPIYVGCDPEGQISS